MQYAIMLDSNLLRCQELKQPSLGHHLSCEQQSVRRCVSTCLGRFQLSYGVPAAWPWQIRSDPVVHSKIL